MNYTPAKPRIIGEPRPLTKEDMGRLFNGAFKPQVSTERLKQSHHRVARLWASGRFKSLTELGEATGYSTNRLATLIDSPAMQELIAKYRSLVTENFAKNVDEFQGMAVENMIRAERMISDRLEDADLPTADPDYRPISIKELALVSRDAADRFGYGKKSLQLRGSVDFAAQLEAARERSSKVIDIDSARKV